jgi:hypothetical protein
VTCDAEGDDESEAPEKGSEGKIGGDDDHAPATADR